MKPFEQELDRIRHNLGQEFNALATLRDNYNMIPLQKPIELIGEALIEINKFVENRTDEGCHECSAPITDNYQIIDGEKYCNGCAKHIRRKDNIGRF